MKAGSELAIHDYIGEVLRTELLSTQIFAIETAEFNPEVSIVLSAHFEHLSAAIVEWLAAKDLAEAELLELQMSQRPALRACGAA